MNHQIENEQMHECIVECWRCRNHCQEIFFNYCLEEGNKHVESDHVKLMIDCIEICQIAADFMTRNSRLHRIMCQTCAEICEACAKSCLNINDTEMKECAEVCETCAKVCRKMTSQ